WVERHGFRQITNPLAHLQRLVEHVEVSYTRRPFTWRHIAGQDTHGGGLACAVWPQKAEDFAGIGAKTHIRKRCECSIALRQMFGFNQTRSASQSKFLKSA